MSDGMAYIVQRKDRFYVVAYDGLDPLTVGNIGGGARSVTTGTRRRTRRPKLVYAAARGNPQGADGMAAVPEGQGDAVIEAADECPGECIFIET